MMFKFNTACVTVMCSQVTVMCSQVTIDDLTVYVYDV